MGLACQAMSIWRVVQVTVAATLLGVIGNFDLAGEIEREALEKVERPARVQREALLQHPIPYDAIVTQSGPGEMPRTRYYVRKEK